MIPSDKKDIESNLMTQARRAQVLMIWTDCDREGEHIGMEIAKVCRKANPTIRVKRARFSAIIAQYAIIPSIQSPVAISFTDRFIMLLRTQLNSTDDKRML